MKTVFALLLFAAASAQAGSISITPGSSVTIRLGEETTVSCGGSSQNKCSCELYTSTGTYYVKRYNAQEGRMETLGSQSTLANCELMTRSLPDCQ